MEGPLDPAFAAMLRDPRLALRRPPPGVTVEQLRAAANAFMAKAPLPEVYSIRDHAAETPAGRLRIRLIRPTDTHRLPLMLFLHGGGFVLGSLDSHEAMARRLALAAGVVVAMVDYRLAPEHPFPAALEDAASGLRWLLDRQGALGLDAGRLALAGDSAGAHAALSLALADLPAAPRHLALLYPLLDRDRSRESARSLDRGYMLTGEFIDWAWESVAIPAERVEADLLSADLSSLPAISVVLASHDPLRDEGLALVERAGACGVAVAHRLFGGMIHGFAGFPHLTKQADAALMWLGERVAQSLH